MTLPVPTEDAEQMEVVRHCDRNNIPRFHVPNETFVKSWAVRNKLKAMGLSSGVPDLFLVVKGRVIAIEMKRTKRSVTSQAQKEWIKELNEAGIEARVCKGADEAKQFIEEVENG